MLFEITIIVLLTFIALKLLLITLTKVKDNIPALIIESILVYPQQIIRNTFDAKLKKFRKYSNVINYFFYLLIVVLFTAWILIP